MTTTNQQQKGFALLVFVTLLATAAATLAVKILNNAGINSQIERDQITANALAQAREALIGRAVSDNNRPGSLPCPDTNNDGIAELFFGNNCPSYIGRLPWRTLGLPDINDGSRERLWYVLSDHFRDNSSAEPINSDTNGTLNITGTQATNNVIAIVFSPGNTLSGQNRSATQAGNCTTTGSILTSSLCASNYLERSNANLNTLASPNLNYQTATSNAAFNDQAITITRNQLFPLIEKRVAKELNSWLQSYYTTNAYYPYPAKYNACDQENCRGDSTVCRGRIPKSEASGSANWNPPAWFRNNQWYREIYYSVSASSVQTPANVTCSNTLSVSGNAARAVFFTPGSPIGTINRPSNTLSNYLEDAENQDGWSGGANDSYVIPTSTSQDRDRLYSFP